jgi:hypothetical protein
MHHLLSILEWALGLSAATIAGLLLVGFVIATVRALLGHKAQPWVVGDVAGAEARSAAEGYPHRVLVAFDIFCNVVFFFGEQDETISTHAYRASLWPGWTHWWGKFMTWWLDLIQPNHGQLAASGDLERATARVSILSKLLGVSK